MIPPNIEEKIGARLLYKPGPLRLIKKKIEDYFSNYHNVGQAFAIMGSDDPYVSVQANFDDLLIPEDHPSRAETDTFYKDAKTVLRTHTSAHQIELINGGHLHFLTFGDCYRKDTVDSSHYPVFHQVEGVCLHPKHEWDTPEKAEKHLKTTLEGLVKHIFGPSIQIKWSTDYFPFTNPSWEMEICLDDRWLEILGCGIIHPDILKRCGADEYYTGWAFGIGLERLAMILYQIPDIRLFWTKDERFLSQFADGDAVFQPYSKHPPVYKDISFWIEDAYHENDFHAIVRNIGGDLIEEVKLIDNFTHPKHGKTNHTYRITYRSMDRSLTNEEINLLQDQIRKQTLQLPVGLR